MVRDEYYRDREVGFEAFAGKNYLFREEFTSRVWATRYDFPALREGRVKRRVIPDERPSGAQGWLLNTRRDKFKDRRVREAMAIAFDFEWTNANLMYGAYERTHSVFQNSDMMAKGEPSPAEIALLEPYRDRVQAEVFGPAWTPPVSDGTSTISVAERGRLIRPLTPEQLSRHLLEQLAPGLGDAPATVQIVAPEPTV